MNKIPISVNNGDAERVSVVNITTNISYEVWEKTFDVTFTLENLNMGEEVKFFFGFTWTRNIQTKSIIDFDERNSSKIILRGMSGFGIKR